MRNIVNNVIGSNDIVGGIVRALVVVAKRHVEMLQDSLRHLHLAMRRGPSADAGSWLFSQLNLQPVKLQPAYAKARPAAFAATPATAAECRRESRYYTASCPSIRNG